MCGVAAIIQRQATADIAQHTYAMLFHLNHRGQDSAGIAVSRQDRTIKEHKGLGSLDRAFFRMRQELKTEPWRGVASLGHLRYATSGVDFSDPLSVEQAKAAIQPMEGYFLGERFLVSYNGNLVPSCVDDLYQHLYRRESVHTAMRDAYVDTELMIRSIEVSTKSTFENALLEAASGWQGAFSAVFLYNNTLYALRDPWGFRPLEFGEFVNGYIISSEDNIFDEAKLPRGRFLHSIKPGYCLILRHGHHEIEIEYKVYRQATPKKCAFEDIYFRRQDSHAFTKERTALFRRKLGSILAREQPPPHNADFVVGVPDSGIHAARGYAERADLPYLQEALFRFHGAERSFIEPVNDLRQQGIELKLGIIPEYINGKVVVVIDDSLVRGNVIPRVIFLLKHHGAREVHVRISSPPITGPCYYGIDTWRIIDELIAHECSDPETIRQLINQRTEKKYNKLYKLDSLGYLSIEGLQRMYENPESMCYACWDKNYPIR
ncbi:MAG: amidophosphoribosyltransferase [Parcubacteria group bacterium Gr01-1014_29]|nr:MAG: amidophosphoribosyltransferase [Parcubacteria group bacterium Gr01-1014_29]